MVSKYFWETQVKGNEYVSKLEFSTVVLSCDGAVVFLEGLRGAAELGIEPWSCRPPQSSVSNLDSLKGWC